MEHRPKKRPGSGLRLIDLSHVIEAGMTTFKGLPGPQICDYWTREASATGYDDGSSFQIGRIDMVANTGTYVDAPFHRYADGKDLAALDLASLACLDGIVVRRPHAAGLATDAADLGGLDVRGKGGADPHRLGPALAPGGVSSRSPLSDEAAAAWLVARRGVSSASTATISTTPRTRARPVHSLLLGADIPIGEHLTNLGALPDTGFRFFSAVPPKVAGMGTFPGQGLRRNLAVQRRAQTHPCSSPNVP
jgi:kynurenine formamidase